MGTEVSKLAIGRETVIGTGDGVGVGPGPKGRGGKNQGCATTSACGLPGRAALKLEAKRIAETESRATERAIWSAAARVELFWRFFILFLGLEKVLKNENFPRAFYAGA